MESIITSMLAIALLIFGAVTTYNATSANVTQAADSVKEVNIQSLERLQTQISLGSIAIDSDGLGFQASVLNNGQETITAFSRMDLIVDYFDGTGARVMRSLSYQTGPASPGEWMVLAITDDRFNPRLLDPGESLVVVGKLTQAIGIGQPIRIVVSSPNGASASAAVTRP